MKALLQGSLGGVFLILGICGGVCRLVLQNRPKISHLPHPFSDLASKIDSKIRTRFQTWRRQKLC